MLDYELAQLVHTLIPFIANAFSMILGIVIANIFWKARIHRYAKTEVVETLEYQKNKIDSLTAEIRRKDLVISDFKKMMKAIKISGLNIISIAK